MSTTYKLTLKIHRYEPESGRKWVQTYEIEAGGIIRFTDVFRKINRDLDPTLAFNSSCEHAQCGSCSVIINQKPMLSCELLVENAVGYFNTTTFTVKPLPIAPVIRDLMVDFEKAYENIHEVKPYIIEPAENPKGGRTYRISPKELEGYVEATRCINCFCCASACISSHRGFLGPNAVLASAVRLMDPREKAEKERLELLFSERGVYRCHTSKACTHVCPKNIDVAHFIGRVKAQHFSSAD